jgi:hypothetical protein
LRVGDIVLPKAEHRKRQSYLRRDEAHQSWAEAKAAYEAQKV